jgi:hypothetical protein
MFLYRVENYSVFVKMRISHNQVGSRVKVRLSLVLKSIVVREV